MLINYFSIFKFPIEAGKTQIHKLKVKNKIMDGGEQSTSKKVSSKKNPSFLESTDALCTQS